MKPFTLSDAVDGQNNQQHLDFRTPTQPSQ